MDFLLSHFTLLGVDLQWWMPILGGVTAVYAFWLVRFGPGVREGALLTCKHRAYLLRGAGSEGLLPYLPVGHDVIGPVDIEIINLVSRYELINIDGAGRLDLDGLEVFVGDFDRLPVSLLS
jgi:hypothetical protein